MAAIRTQGGLDKDTAGPGSGHKDNRNQTQKHETSWKQPFPKNCRFRGNLCPPERLSGLWMRIGGNLHKPHAPTVQTSTTPTTPTRPSRPRRLSRISRLFANAGFASGGGCAPANPTALWKHEPVSCENIHPSPDNHGVPSWLARAGRD